MIQQNIVKVGMADLNIATDRAVLKTTGLGSCVGLTLFDERTRIAGMAHVMLPSSQIAREASINIAKFADTAIPDLIERMKRAGADSSRLIAKMAGGAQMFAFTSQSDAMRIGPRNVESCKEMLDKLRIKIAAEDTGGNYGRTIELDSNSGILSIRSVQFGIKEI
ncbi:chemoreceptor glutamine deamidase CheD [Paenibacillus baekrokdamisoli]|uniref:Probable chemoreceptor glutamine deamidase CheD n=1 Tax=Paenibacillus baekrokdamisoli TaxID=1712516 RepID=A0A3G9IPR5_9BACL|nr:chemotaxis protein CheD [Paenibacillus baekrokdamisoli]MBB3069796.1 chemotaxis protein CheD [Paenibacillus baekrokdamisoli]BBH20850.1 chemoreceptor glutamine deamidase CheD [Paenibacillus baekrokdamisoli]